MARPDHCPQGNTLNSPCHFCHHVVLSKANRASCHNLSQNSLVASHATKGKSDHHCRSYPWGPFPSAISPSQSPPPDPATPLPPHCTSISPGCIPTIPSAFRTFHSQFFNSGPSTFYSNVILYSPLPLPFSSLSVVYLCAPPPCVCVCVCRQRTAIEYNPQRRGYFLIVQQLSKKLQTFLTPSPPAL